MQRKAQEMARNFNIPDGLAEDDFWRLKMGRFNEAEEREIERVIRGRSGKLWRVLGWRGGHYFDLRCPGLLSTRPRTPEGGETFIFRHNTISKRRYAKTHLKERTYLRFAGRGRGGELRPAGARFARHVCVGGASGGAWWVPKGEPLPRGTQAAPEGEVFPVQLGLPLGAAARRQRYIERPEAVEETRDVTGGVIQASSAGNIAVDTEAREAFWRAVEARERGDGRVQSQVIAELPYEPEIGPEGRLRIVERFGQAFGDLGIRWHAAVHLPDGHSDPRNYHMHLLYHDRPGEKVNGLWKFTEKKVPKTRDRGFVKRLRGQYAEIVNKVLEEAGIRRRYDPRSYRDMGIDKVPGKHLGVAASALERKGVVTANGVRNVIHERCFELARELETVATGLASDMARLEQIVPFLEEAEARLSPRVRRAAERHSEAGEGFAEAATAHRRFEAEAALARLRAKDLAQRAKIAAKFNNDPKIRREAKLVADDLKELTRSQLRAATDRLKEARRTRARAEGHMIRGLRKLEAELLIDRRAKVMAGIEQAQSRMTDGRMPEILWRQEGEALEKRRMEAETKLKRARRRLETLLAPMEPDEARRALRNIEDMYMRDRAFADIKGLAWFTKGHETLLEIDLKDLSAASKEVYSVLGKIKVRERTEADPGRFKKRVRSADEESGLIATIRILCWEMTGIDREILSSGAAKDLANELGLGGRIGTQAAEIEQWIGRWHQGGSKVPMDNQENQRRAQANGSPASRRNDRESLNRNSLGVVNVIAPAPEPDEQKKENEGKASKSLEAISKPRRGRAR